MTKYRLTDAAREDLENIYRYGLQTFGEQQADRYYFGLVTCLERIAENPLLYPAVDHIKSGYRRCTYISERIYHRIDGDTVIISAIIGRQDEIKRLWLVFLLGNLNMFDLVREGFAHQLRNIWRNLVTTKKAFDS